MLNLKFEHVRAFLHVARDRGNKKAANALNLTQPAITARINNLEMVLGTELFDRTTGKRRLSKKGELLLDYADKLEHLVTQIERDVAEPKGIENFLRIGVAETIAQSWMPKVIKELERSLPKLRVELVIDISSRLLEPLANREIDIAIANGISADERVQRRPLSQIPLQWYTSANDPVDDPEKARAFFGKPVITYPRNTEPYLQAKKAIWSKAGQHVPLFPSSSMPCAVQLVAAGMGIAALPYFLVERHLKDGSIINFDPGWAPEPVSFAVYFIDDPVNPVVEHVLDIAHRIASAEHCCAHTETL